MKKFITTIIITLLSFINIAHAKSLPENSHWYIGANSNSLQLLKKKEPSSHLVDKKKYQNFLKKIFGLNPSLFFGYAINPNLSFELATNISTEIPKKITLKIPQVYLSNVDYLTRLTLPVNRDFFLYTKLGASIVADPDKKVIHSLRLFQAYKKIVPLLSFGLEYLFSKNLYLHVNYHIKNNISKIFNSNVKSVLENLNIGISWKKYKNSKKIISIKKNTYKNKKKTLKQVNNIFKKFKKNKKKILVLPKLLKIFRFL